MGNYIGRSLDKISNIEILDNITFDGSSSYSITKGSVAFTPNSAQSCLISIDGVVQATNFTVSSSTIDFGVAIPSTSVCNFFLHYGTGVMTVPSDGSVTTAKLGNSAVDLTSKVTGALPVANGGTNLTSGFANGITEADMFRLTADIAQGTNAVISSNLERVDDSNFSKIGTGMSESSGVFTFGATGLYHLIANPLISSYNDNNSYISAELSTDSGSNFTETLFVTNNGIDGTPRMNSSVYQSTFLNVTNATTFRVRFKTSTFSSNTYVYGNTNENYTTFTFIRLGDSQ